MLCGGGGERDAIETIVLGLERIINVFDRPLSACAPRLQKGLLAIKGGIGGVGVAIATRHVACWASEFAVYVRECMCECVCVCVCVCVCIRRSVSRKCVPV
jgi:hypothetical protein